MHDLFIAHESLYKKKELKCNIIMIVLIRKNISDICINIDGNMVGSYKICTHYLLHNINIDRNMIDS